MNAILKQIEIEIEKRILDAQCMQSKGQRVNDPKLIVEGNKLLKQALRDYDQMQLDLMPNDPKRGDEEEEEET